MVIGQFAAFLFDNLLVNVTFSLESHCFEGCGDCARFPTGPSAERSTSHRFRQPGQAGTFSVEPIPIKALVISAI